MGSRPDRHAEGGFLHPAATAPAPGGNFETEPPRGGCWGPGYRWLPPEGSLKRVSCPAGHRGMPPDPTRMKTRHPRTWRRILTSSEISGPQVSEGPVGLAVALPAPLWDSWDSRREGGSGPADSLPGSRAGAASPFCLQK